MNEGKFANALGAYSTIETPQAAFNAAQVCVSVRNVSVTFPPLFWPNYIAVHARYLDDPWLMSRACASIASFTEKALVKINLFSRILTARFENLRAQSGMWPIPSQET